MNITPDLAESWDQPDPLTYIFHLRRGVKFHDGRPFTSADVKFTFDSILSGAIKTVKRGGSFSLVESIDAPDDFTVVFHLREAYASFLWSMTRPGNWHRPEGFGQKLRPASDRHGPISVREHGSGRQYRARSKSRLFR